MSSDRFITDNDTEFVEADLDELWDGAATSAKRDLIADSRSDDPSVELQNPERKYSVGGSQQFSHYLNKDTSSRYQAIVLNVATGEYNSSHYEVGLVEINNSDHRNGVIHALRVSPFHVHFVSLDKIFFEYMHSHIYDARAQSLVLEHQQKKQSQKTKQWGEGKTTLNEEEAYAAIAASDADLQNEAEEEALIQLLLDAQENDNDNNDNDNSPPKDDDGDATAPRCPTRCVDLLEEYV